MTSLESVVAAVASMHGLTSLYPGLWYPFGNSQVDGTDLSGSSNGKVGNSANCNSEEVVGASGIEQPLDLSAKSSSVGSLDQKNIFKAKPRPTTISGRRTYTEDELQCALQDILSGKLGTRRAAVLYGIPRSTLRNKVYKLAIEQKREANLAAPALAALDEDDKDCSGTEEEKEVERTLNLLPSEDVLRLADSDTYDKFNKCEHRPEPLDNDGMPVNIPEISPTTSNHQTPPMNIVDPNLILQGLLIGGALSGLTANKGLESTLGMLPEFIRNLLLQNEMLKGSDGRTSKSNTPETASICSTGRSGSEHNEIIDESPLKVHSIKPAMSGSNPSPISGSPSIRNFLTKNGDPEGNKHPAPAQVAGITSESPNLLGDQISPPLSTLGSVTLRDVIAKSISETMHANNPLEKRELSNHSPHGLIQSGVETYKRPKISVKQGLGAEVHRFGGGLLASGVPPNFNSLNNNQLNNSTGTGGKGTRPKRGKYRNYDRDSLVEAVKAVQRGEMSVHRAGSYYGVPHSTLEYKVKERHLMRPRKREPKQTMDDRNSNISTAGVKTNDLGQGNRISLDKSKVITSQTKSPNFDTLPSNGTKTLLDPSSNSLQYPPLFWTHPPSFLDFSRATGVVGPSSGGTPFSPSENFFQMQMRQRFQDQGTASDPGNSATSNSSGSRNSSANNSKSTTPNSAGLGSSSKSLGLNQARELTESLYDSASGNGLLDGIIRQTLDRKSESQHGTLIDQLKNNIQLTKLSEARKRELKSPLDFASSVGIKMERTTPDLEVSSDEKIGADNLISAGPFSVGCVKKKMKLQIPDVEQLISTPTEEKKEIEDGV